MSDCLFRKVVASELSAKKLYEKKTVPVMRDINPKNPMPPGRLSDERPPC